MCCLSYKPLAVCEAPSLLKGNADMPTMACCDWHAWHAEGVLRWRRKTCRNEYELGQRYSYCEMTTPFEALTTPICLTFRCRTFIRRAPTNLLKTVPSVSGSSQRFGGICFASSSKQSRCFSISCGSCSTIHQGRAIRWGAVLLRVDRMHGSCCARSGPQHDNTQEQALASMKERGSGAISLLKPAILDVVPEVKGSVVESILSSWSIL